MKAGRASIQRSWELDVMTIDRSYTSVAGMLAIAATGIKTDQAGQPGHR